MGVRRGLRSWKERATQELATLRAIVQHPRAPKQVKWLAIALVAYAVSPIDLIPDFIPVLGQLDEAVILPLGIWLLYRLTPPDVVSECRGARRAPN